MVTANAPAEIARISGLISEEHKKVDALYSQIGKLYVQLHQHDCDENMRLLVTDLLQANQLIEEYQNQILTLRGYVRCAQCGDEMPSNTGFCSTCGAPLPKVETVAPVAEDPQMHCTKCGMVLTPDVRFCTSCGTRVATES